MAALLPSQRQDRVYVGPNGTLVRQAALPEDDDDEDEQESAKPKRRWQQLKKNIVDESSGVAERAYEASYGVSTTRASSKLADDLASALATARINNAPSLVDSIDDQCQVEILAALPIGATRSAARVCKAWHDAFASDVSGLWQQLVAAASARTVAAASAQLRASSAGACITWVALGRQMQATEFALRGRWLSGTCGEA